MLTPNAFSTCWIGLPIEVDELPANNNATGLFFPSSAECHSLSVSGMPEPLSHYAALFEVYAF